MKYETPELTALTPAINAIQGGKPGNQDVDSFDHDPIGAYEDWE
jgi:hypothetical protein